MFEASVRRDAAADHSDGVGSSLDGDGGSSNADVASEPDARTRGVDPMLDPPRAIAPLSTSTVTQQNPQLRWALHGAIDGAEIDLCRTRDCATVMQTFGADGDQARVPSTLAPGVWFWRARGRTATTVGQRTSPVWWFRVGARSAPNGTSWGTELDVNGDGYGDLAVASVGYMNGTGRVDVFYGGASGIATTPSVTLVGAAIDERFGSSVASAGDVNGDGFGDLIVGASHADVRSLRAAGVARLYLGSASGLASTASRLLQGTVDGGLFGFAVASCGDANGDGYADIAVGAPMTTYLGRISAGTVAVFVGSSDGLPLLPAMEMHGESQGHELGWSIAGVDVNGDERGDLVIGAHLAAGPSMTLGGFAVFHGSSSVFGPRALFVQSSDVDQLGSSVSNAGDVNGDGFGDVVVGAWFADVRGQAQAGRAFSYFGSLRGLAPTHSWRVEGAMTDDQAGWAVSGA